jgi:hypothetical protein
MKLANVKLLSAVAVLGLVGVAAFAADAVEPVSVAITNKRAEAAATISGLGTVYQGTTLVFTNCQLYADAAGTTKQGLDGVTVQIAVGTLTTNITYTATTQGAASNGLWFCTGVAVPQLTGFFVQVKVTDSLTNSFIYPNKAINTEQSMFD